MRRVPGDLYGPILWCGLLAVLVGAGAAGAPTLRQRLIYGAVALLYLALALALFRLRPWARIAAIVLFSLAAVRLGVQVASSGFSGSRVLLLAVNGLWIAYFLRPSTRRVFAAAGDAAVDLPGCLSRLLLVGVLLSAAVPLAYSKLSALWIATIVVALVILWAAFLRDPVERVLRRRLAARPAELDDPSWARFRRALELRAAGDVDGAFEILDGLPPVPCVRALQGLLFLARPDDAGLLRRFVFDSAYAPDAAAFARLAEEARDPSIDVDACVEERAEVVDALLADAFSARPLFANEGRRALERVSGRVFGANEDYAHRDAWAAARPLSTGARGRVWLALRLWEAGAHAAAEAVADGSRDPQLQEIAGLSRRFSDAAREGTLTPAWVEENAHAMCVLPMFVDAFRLLHLELPYLERAGEEAASSRLLRRLELFTALRRWRDDYPFEAGAWTSTLLALLAGQDRKLTLKKARFDAWWAERRESQAAFDARLAAGLEAAGAEHWEAAATAFAEAAAAWPERACARHNQALCLLKLERAAEADPLLDALTREDPDEPLYWLRLGDARRARGLSREALAAYRRAAKLGGLEQAASVRLGLALADEGRDDEAKKELDAAAGPEPDADTLESLADFLENEGVFRLAHHYRQKALGERLKSDEENPPPKDDDEDEDEPRPA